MHTKRNLPHTHHLPTVPTIGPILTCFQCTYSVQETTASLQVKWTWRNSFDRMPGTALLSLTTMCYPLLVYQTAMAREVRLPKFCNNPHWHASQKFGKKSKKVNLSKDCPYPHDCVFKIYAIFKQSDSSPSTPPPPRFFMLSAEASSKGQLLVPMSKSPRQGLGRWHQNSCLFCVIFNWVMLRWYMTLKCQPFIN